jgi:hypothetical protein
MALRLMRLPCKYESEAMLAKPGHRIVAKIYYLELLHTSEGTLNRWSRLHLQSLAPTPVSRTVDVRQAPGVSSMLILRMLRIKITRNFVIHVINNITILNWISTKLLIRIVPSDVLNNPLRRTEIMVLFFFISLQKHKTKVVIMYIRS